MHIIVVNVFILKSSPYWREYDLEEKVFWDKKQYQQVGDQAKDHVEWTRFDSFCLKKCACGFCPGDLLYLFLQFSDVFCIFLCDVPEDLIQMQHFEFSHS